MQEKRLIEKCKSFLEKCKNAQEKTEEKRVLTYYGEPIENLIEQLLILIEAKDEERKMQIHDNNILYDRLSHLLMSDTIKKYDAKDGKGKYIRNIRELDESFKEENYFKKYIEKEKENSFNQGIINQLLKDMMLYEQIGYLKGKNVIPSETKMVCDKNGDFKIENFRNL